MEKTEMASERTLKLSDLSGAPDRRYALTPVGCIHLTPTELQLVRIIEEMEGIPISKAELARKLHRNERVIGRLISHLRSVGVLVSEAVYSTSGAQIANRYRVSDEARPYEADLMIA